MVCVGTGIFGCQDNGHDEDGQDEEGAEHDEDPLQQGLTLPGKQAAPHHHPRLKVQGPGGTALRGLILLQVSVFVPLIGHLWRNKIQVYCIMLDKQVSI